MPTYEEFDDVEDEVIPGVTLKLDCYPDELSPAQLAAFTKAEKEHTEIQSKLSSVIKDGENVFSGEIFKAYQLVGNAASLDRISQNSIALLKKQTTEEIETTATKTTRSERAAARGEAMKKRTYQEIDTEFYEDDEDYMPLSKRSTKSKEKKEKEKVKEIENLEKSPVAPTIAKDKIKKPKNTALSEAPTKIQQTSTVRPSESTAVGGLSVGTDGKKAKEGTSVVDLTSEENGNKVAADSREISFNKLQGKTFPSLVVVARPCLKVKDNAPSDRGLLDAKVKNVLMHTATKFTEWLIQQGLVRSEQTCLNHSNVNLKLGMYSDATKFPYSGGYVWISDCCQSRFVSVFNGSIFEGSSHPPSVILKLIYHWACQTNVQNVVQWVKVDNLFVKGLNTWLRAICTVALHQHMTLLGGHGKKIEVGVISLGTTTQDGQQRQVKVEVLGVLDPEAKLVRLRAVEPLNEGERNYKKRFSKILEPLSSWVHKDSTILTDLTVDKGTLNSMGYKTVSQTSSSSDSQNRSTNSHIMDYLRRIVPRMFQNTLSLLSRQIIQQFLDELVWREWFGVSPGQAFDNIVVHISEQTRLDNKETLVTRLNRVSANPFKNWSSLESDSSSASTSSKDATASTSSSGRNRNRKRPTKETSPVPKTQMQSSIKKKPEHKENIETSFKKEPAKKIEKKKIIEENFISLEDYYYGIWEDSEFNENDRIIADFKGKCSECNLEFLKSTEFLDHLYTHANPSNDEGNWQCRYCLENWVNEEALRKHTLLNHPIETKNIISSTFNCIICENRYSTIAMLGGHMHKHHFPSEMPYKCCVCNFMSSSQHITVDHYYEKHQQTNILQCPFCLKGNTIFLNGNIIIENIKSFVIHLRKHLNQSQCKKCNRCSLWFMHNGALKTHQIFMHISRSYMKSEIKQLCEPSAKISQPKTLPKPCFQKDALPYKILEKYISLTNNCDEGLFCLECGTNFDDNQHLLGLMKCLKCLYKTCCMPAMLDHTSMCIGAFLPEKSISSTLEIEMHCLCGFSSSDGNALARHLAMCERRSAYPSLELVQENTVKRNMLDMLGLVRRADETDGDNNSTLNESVSHSETVQDDQSYETSEQTDTSVIGQTTEQQQYDQIMDTNEHFNTQLSLDDLGPPSVLAPPTSEPDRTPQLKEYQSLATPRVLHLEQGVLLEQNDYESTDQMQSYENL